MAKAATYFSNTMKASLLAIMATLFANLSFFAENVTAATIASASDEIPAASPSPTSSTYYPTITMYPTKKPTSSTYYPTITWYPTSSKWPTTNPASALDRSATAATIASASDEIPAASPSPTSSTYYPTTTWYPTSSAWPTTSPASALDRNRKHISVAKAPVKIIDSIRK